MGLNAVLSKRKRKNGKGHSGTLRRTTLNSNGYGTVRRLDWKPKVCISGTTGKLCIQSTVQVEITRQWNQSPCLGGPCVNTNNRINSLGDSSAGQHLSCCCCATPCSVCSPLWLLQLWLFSVALVVSAVCPVHIPETTEWPRMGVTNLIWAITNLICIWTSYVRGKNPHNHRSKDHQSPVAW